MHITPAQAQQTSLPNCFNRTASHKDLDDQDLNHYLELQYDPLKAFCKLLQSSNFHPTAPRRQDPVLCLSLSLSLSLSYLHGPVPALLGQLSQVLTPYTLQPTHGATDLGSGLVEGGLDGIALFGQRGQLLALLLARVPGRRDLRLHR